MRNSGKYRLLKFWYRPLNIKYELFQEDLVPFNSSYKPYCFAEGPIRLKYGGLSQSNEVSIARKVTSEFE